MKVIYSPLRFPGGKSTLLKSITQRLPEEITELVSPFIGGGSIEIWAEKQGMAVYANDKFEPLANFWQCAIEDAERVANIAWGFKPGLDRHRQAWLREILQNFNWDGDRFTLAAIYYVVNRTSFSGTTLTGGFSPKAEQERFTESITDRLANFCAPYLTVHCLDFRDFLRTYPKGFVYADPPYCKIGGLYGDRGDMTFADKDHKDLFDIMSARKTRWAISYNNHPEVIELYSQFNIAEIGRSASMSNGRRICPEILITNY